MTSNEEKKIDKIISDTLKLNYHDLDKTLYMDNVEGWDSLTHMNLIMALEAELGITLSGDDIAKMTDTDAIKHTVNTYISHW